MSEHNDDLVGIAANLVQALIAARDIVSVGDVSPTLTTIHATLKNLRDSSAPKPLPEPAVPVKQSVKPDYIVCLEDGKKLKMLKRHLMQAFNMTPEQYRERWGLIHLTR